MNILAAFVIGIVAIVGSFFPRTSVWDKPSNNFGSTNFPASLDVLVNPGATDSVATVSHSSQHANANDAIEALEAKLGIGASTATNGTVLFGNGVGSSAWSASPSLSTLNLSGLGTFNSFISQASSTIIGGLTITGNSTTTNATSTNFFSTTASTTNLYGTNINGFSLVPCSGSDFLQWSSGTFNCGTPSITTAITASTTGNGGTATYLAYTASMQAGDVIQWTGSCFQDVNNIQPKVSYKTSNDSATTTLFVASGAFGHSATLTGVFSATTTYNVTVEFTSGGNCGKGSTLTYVLTQ
jgi:hypothetical protein